MHDAVRGRTLRLVHSVEPEAGKSGNSFEQDHPLDANRELRAIEQDRELIANHGEYLSKRYNPNGDDVAAQKNGVDYPSLVKSTDTDFSAAPSSSETKK